MSHSAGRGPTLDGLVIAADPARWLEAGFDIDSEGRCAIGAVTLHLTGKPASGAAAGIAAWALRGAAGDIDGLTVAPVQACPASPGEHANGACGIDHVVVFTPDLDRTVAALEAAGLNLRRVREVPGEADPPVRQAFFRLGEPILEVVGPVGEDRQLPATFWGLVVVVSDLDAAAAALGERLGAPRGAVQAGRRIATVRESARLGVPVAFMTPHRRRLLH